MMMMIVIMWEYGIKRDIIKLLAQRPFRIHCKTSVSDSGIYFMVENQWNCYQLCCMRMQSITERVINVLLRTTQEAANLFIGVIFRSSSFPGRRVTASKRKRKAFFHGMENIFNDANLNYTFFYFSPSSPRDFKST